MTQKEIIKAIEVAIDDSIKKIQSVIPKQERAIFEKVSLIVKDLDIKNGKIEQSVKNLRTIGKVKAEIEQIVNSKEWKDEVKDYLKGFDEVAKLQNEYFKTIESKYTPPKLLAELKQQSIGATMNSLMEAGIGLNVTEQIQTILRQNITTGGSYLEFTEALRESITSNKSGKGVLDRYVKQITTDALNQFSRQYSTLVADSLGLEWFIYSGAIIETSRTFCKALIKKKYVHRSELPRVIVGDFKEFKDMDGKINEKTDLPEGMIAGTNVANFSTYAGGWQCNHQIHPVNALAVPATLRAKYS